VDPKARVKAIQDAASAIEALVINAKGALRLTSDPAVRRDLSTAVRLVGENTLGVFQAAATKVRLFSFSLAYTFFFSSSCRWTLRPSKTKIAGRSG
jgi:hypothetical protein